MSDYVYTYTDFESTSKQSERVKTDLKRGCRPVTLCDRLDENNKDMLHELSERRAETDGLQFPAIADCLRGYQPLGVSNNHSSQPIAWLENLKRLKNEKLSGTH